VEDLALALSTIVGPDADTPLSLQESGESFARDLGRDFKGVRVAWYVDLNGIPFDPRVRAVIDPLRKVFEDLGCIVEETEPDFADAEVSFRTLRAWRSGLAHGARLKQHPDGFKDVLRWEIEEGLKLTGSQVAEAEAAHTRLWREFHKFMGRYDYFILPTTQLPPFDVNVPYPTEITGVKFTNYIDWMKSCWYISATGSPAASVPAGFTPEGLPIGIQIVGRDRADFAVLQMAYAFEQATGFGRIRPGVF
jgi:amidase